MWHGESNTPKCFIRNVVCLCFCLKINYLAKIFINIFQSKDKNMYICKNDKSMEMTATDTFEKQDLFYNRMIEDYKNGVIPHSSVFEPYFKWKMGECSHDEITREMAYVMMDEASMLLDGYYNKYPKAYENMDAYIDEDPWQQYKGFGEDKYVVSYLEGIDSELKNMIMILL